MRAGAITIGQSPRVDVLPDIRPMLPGVEIVERGALDGLDDADLAVLAKCPSGNLLATRLFDGREIVIGEEVVTPLLRKGIAELEYSGVDLIMVLCTGSFPPLESKVPLLVPDRILQRLATSVPLGPTLGIITPNEGQTEPQLQRWSKMTEARVVVASASPYRPGVSDSLDLAAERLREAGASTVVMDCIGYSIEMRDRVKATLGVPTLVARTALARVTAELLGI